MVEAVMPTIIWDRECRKCGKIYKTWEVVSDTKRDQKFGWFGDSTGLCPECRKELEEPA